jgi:hypothetical protein
MLWLSQHLILSRWALVLGVWLVQFFFCLGELRFWSREMKGTIERLGDGGL